MLHHVSVGVTDVLRAAKFYDATLGALGYKRVMEYLPYAIAYGERGTDGAKFWIQLPHDQKPMSVGNGTHVGFVAKSKQAVQKFHAAALKAGGSNNGEPGPRPDYGSEYYGAFTYDLDGNKLEATLRAAAKPAAKPKAKAKTAKKPAKKAAPKKKTKAKRR